MEICDKDPSCVGFVKSDKMGTKYGTRGITGYKAKLKGTTAWTCFEVVLKCTKFPLQHGSERERCEGGNDLRREYEYVYNDKTCGCKCCRRNRKMNSDTDLPKVMTVLIVNVNMTDYHPENKLKFLENQV